MCYNSFWLRIIHLRVSRYCKWLHLCASEIIMMVFLFDVTYIGQKLALYELHTSVSETICFVNSICRLELGSIYATGRKKPLKRQNVFCAETLLCDVFVLYFRWLLTCMPRFWPPEMCTFRSRIHFYELCWQIKPDGFLSCESDFV